MVVYSMGTTACSMGTTVCGRLTGGVEKVLTGGGKKVQRDWGRAGAGVGAGVWIGVRAGVALYAAQRRNATGRRTRSGA